MRIDFMFGMVAIALTLGAAVPVHASDKGPMPSDLRKAADEYDKAQERSDEGELRRLVADEYVLVNSGGAVETKATFISESVDPQFKLNPFKVEDEVVRISRDQAVLGGIANLSGTDHGRSFSARLRFADVWQKRSGRWQVVYTQVTRTTSTSAAR